MRNGLFFCAKCPRMTKPGAAMLRGGQLGEERAEFALGLLVMLFDREPQRGFEFAPGVGGAAGRQELFSQQETRDHPVGLLSEALFEVRDRFRAACFCDQRLRETEAEKFVFRLGGDERLKLIDA